MDGFKNIDTRNFRGIEHLKNGDFAKVNVFLGQNNLGKSSVLKMFMLFMCMPNPDMLQQQNILRTNAFSPFGNIILYCSSYKKLWEVISILVSEINNVFIATYSKDTLMKVYEMLEEYNEYQEMCRPYTIEKVSQKGHKICKYSYE